MCGKDFCRPIPIKERTHFNIYAEFLNALNHANWTVIDSFSGEPNNPAEYANVNSSTFRNLRLANRPRSIQFHYSVCG